MQMNLLVCVFVCVWERQRQKETEGERQSVREMHQTMQDGHLWGVGFANLFSSPLGDISIFYNVYYFNNSKK